MTYYPLYSKIFKFIIQQFKTNAKISQGNFIAKRWHGTINQNKKICRTLV